MADNEAKISIVADASGVAPGAQEAVKQVQAIAPATKEAAKGFGDIKATADDAFRAVASTAEASSKGVAAALDRQAVSAAQTKFAMRDLSYQISDVSTSLSSGISPMVVFAQQGSQIVGAISLMKGESSAFVNFLSGPWGAAIMGAIGFIGILATSHKDAAGAEKDHASAAEQLKAALERLNNATAANNHETRQGIQADIDAANAERTRAAATLEAAKAAVIANQAQSRRAAGEAGEGSRGAAGGTAALLGITEGEVSSLEAQIARLNVQIRAGTGKIVMRDVESATDKAKAATHAYEDAMDKLQRQYQAGKIGEASFKAQAIELTKTRDAALDAARAAKSGNTAELDASAKLATADTAAERARAQLTLTRIKAREELKAGTITAEQYLAKVSAAEGAVQDATAKKPKKAPSRMGEWEASLEEQKVALAEMADKEGSFRQMSEQEEANYWDAIRKRADLSHEEQIAADKKYYALRQSIRKDDFDAHIATLNREIDAAKGNASEQIRIATQIADGIKQKYGERSKEYEQAQARILQIAQRAAEQEMRIAEQTAQFHRRLDDERFRQQVQGIQLKTDLGLQSPTQEVRAMVAAENARWSKESISLSASVRGAEGNDEAQRNALLAQRTAYQQHQAALTQLARQGVLARTQVERNAIGSVAQSWSQNIARMLTLQQGFGESVRGIYLGLVGAVANALAQMLEQWIAMQLTKLIIGGATEKATAAGTISAEAAKAGAGGTASMAAAPFPLNLGAPAFGASMAAAAASYAALVAIPSAEGGWWEVPGGGAGVDGKGGQLGIVHPKEMVLPAGLATPLRDMVASGGVPAIPANDTGGGRPGGDTYNLHFNGPTNRKQIEKWLSDMGSGVLTAAKRGVRNNGSPF